VGEWRKVKEKARDSTYDCRSAFAILQQEDMRLDAAMDDEDALDGPALVSFFVVVRLALQP
jgi:hypothetical protein